ncbi:MAG: hypothetical protein LW721_05190 [Flammeovirgaceae bacterium]|jgi:hypothetical protein|nr:hypothetical protein [Flammeovirgaceae bacterium]
MKKVLSNLGNGQYGYIPLQDSLIKYYKTEPEGWLSFVKDYVDAALNIKNEKDYEKYLENNSFLKMITNAGGKFDYLEIQRFYEALKKSKYNKMFDDDILRFISYIRGLSFFDIIGYELDRDNPDLDEWFNSKNAFKYGLTEEELKNVYSMMDLLPLKYGMNAIRGQLLKANKRIW